VQPGTVTAAAAAAIAYARAQIGKPYLWGGTGPGAFDCSGLVMQAWAAAGVHIPRTSQEQWAALPHIAASQVRPGDLVFFPGGDGTWAAPGHVALVLSDTTMLQAYATGTPVEISPLNGNGAGGIVGYARPGGA
jgi:cell wall-associated NlpC family hydrolase